MTEPNISLYTLTSPIHDKQAIERQTNVFLTSLQKSGLTFSRHDEDYSSYGTADQDIVFVRTGGTEGVFLELVNACPDILSRPVCLLASGESNSLAASVEILSWLQQHGYQGEILHGTPDMVAARADRLAHISKAKKQLHGQRAGIIGKPSDWLIASQADDEAVAKKLGVTLVSVSMQELLDEIAAVQNCNEPLPDMMPCDSRYWQGAVNIYYALKSICSRYRLDALTLRCFDLLTTVRNTGCLALAMLNAQGVPAACEGDVPALLTMMISQALTGQTGFQANPSRINADTGEILFAHCTVPLNMIRRYTYDTHFESGIGVALHGEIPEGDATVFKVSGNLNQWFAEDIKIVKNTCEECLCRTQIVVRTDETAEYLLHHPIGNHQIILCGQHSRYINELMSSL